MCRLRGRYVPGLYAVVGFYCPAGKSFFPTLGGESTSAVITLPMRTDRGEPIFGQPRVGFRFVDGEVMRLSVNDQELRTECRGGRESEHQGQRGDQRPPPGLISLPQVPANQQVGDGTRRRSHIDEAVRELDKT